MKKIDLIIPCYNTHKTLYRLFGSIMSQTIKDEIHVILVDDCSDETYDELIKPFKDILDIEIVKLKENSGPGTARRVGMQSGKSKYIMFADSDDTFNNAFSIETLYHQAETEMCDIVYSDFLEENDRREFNIHKNDNVWVFGKIYKRDFIERMNIYFNDTRSNEDVGFNTLTRAFTQPSYVPIVTYVWHNNPKSITRINNCLYSFTCQEGFLFNKTWAFKEAYKKGWGREFYLQAILDIFIHCYFDYFNFARSNREEVHIEDYEKWVKKYYKDFGEEINECINKGMLEKMYKDAFISYYNNFDNICIQNFSIYDFIKKMEE